MNEKNYDLHCHTTASDGHLSPKDVLLRAIEKKVDVLAITDHDTVSGLLEAKALVENEHLPIQLINGIEISTNWFNHDIHIVGLNIDPHSSVLEKLIERQKICREERAYLIAERLEKLGYKEVYKRAQAYANGRNAISRSHFARYLVESGVVKNNNAAFDKFLGKGKIAYVPCQWCSIEDAINAIHLIKGIAVLAHPMRYDMSSKKLRVLIQQFKDAGGDAIEVVSGQLTPDKVQYVAKLANEFELLASRGSDFHYPCPWLDIGIQPRLPVNVEPIWYNW